MSDNLLFKSSSYWQGRKNTQIVREHIRAHVLEQEQNKNMKNFDIENKNRTILYRYWLPEFTLIVAQDLYSKAETIPSSVCRYIRAYLPTNTTDRELIVA